MRNIGGMSATRAAPYVLKWRDNIAMSQRRRARRLRAPSRQGLAYGDFDRDGYEFC